MVWGARARTRGGGGGGGASSCFCSACFCRRALSQKNIDTPSNAAHKRHTLYAKYTYLEVRQPPLVRRVDALRQVAAGRELGDERQAVGLRQARAQQAHDML
jgi:hypothetical protein